MMGRCVGEPETIYLGIILVALSSPFSVEMGTVAVVKLCFKLHQGAIFAGFQIATRKKNSAIR